MTEARQQGGQVWKWIAISCGGCLLLSIVAIAGLGFFVFRSLGIKSDPQEVERLAQEIISYEFPGEPDVAFAVEPFGMQMAALLTEDASIQLFVGKLPAELAQGTDPDDIRREFTSQMNIEDLDIQASSQEIELYTICDQEVDVNVTQGTVDNDPAISYTTAIEDGGAIIFTIITATGNDAEQKASGILESLNCN